MTERATVASASPRGTRVVVRDVFRIFRDGPIETVALRGVDLDVPAGAHVAIVGRSGSGKSTLLNLIAATDRPSAGSIEIDGTEIGQAGDATRAELRGRTIGHVAQAGNLVEFLDLVENVQLAAALADRHVSAQDAGDALGRVGLGSRLRRRPTELSGGEQQRAALALALAMRPPLLLADEITGELDQATAATVLDTLDEVRRETGMTVVVVTHDDAVARRAGQVHVLRDGRFSDDPMVTASAASGGAR